MEYFFVGDKKIVSIVSKDVLSIPTKECFEPLVNLKTERGFKVVKSPDYLDKETEYSFVRRSVADRLLRAQSLLKDGIFIRLFEGLRSINVQHREFYEQYNRVKNSNRDMSDFEIFSETTKLVSPVINFDGTMNTPTHSTGAAVDVDLVDSNGDPLDLGMEIKDWNVVDPSICATHADNISSEAINNRKMLLDVMQSAGFINYFTEWWHYSYGDRYWAYQTGADFAIFGVATDGISREKYW